MFRKSKTISFSTILLAVLFASICQAAYSQNTMGINQIAGLNIPYQFERAGIQGDSLALFHYGVADNVISISRAYVSPQGTLLLQEDIFTYEVNPDWGTLVTAPLAFEFKNGKLYTAFKTDTKLMVFFTDTSHTDTHVFDVNGINFSESLMFPYGQFLIQNEDIGYIAHSVYDYPFREHKVYRLDFNTDSLVVMLESNSYSFNFSPLGSNYVLVSQFNWDTGPDFLIEGESIVQTFENNWFPYQYMYIWDIQHVCGNYYSFALNDGLDMRNGSIQVFVYVENHELHYIGEQLEVGNRFFLGSSSNFAAHSDSTYTSITGLYNNIYDPYQPPVIPEFVNRAISNNQVIEQNTFPDLSHYTSPSALKKMDSDYMLAVSGNVPRCFTLVDYPNQLIRDFYFPLENGFWGNLYSSPRYLYYINSTKVYVFHLELMTPVADEQLTPAPTSISTYPNPFSSICNIEVKSPQNSFADIAVYNLKGQLVKTLHNGIVTSSKHSYIWDGKDASNGEVASGVYFIKMTTKTGTYTQRTLLLR